MGMELRSLWLIPIFWTMCNPEVLKSFHLALNPHAWVITLMRLYRNPLRHDCQFAVSLAGYESSSSSPTRPQHPLMFL